MPANARSGASGDAVPPAEHVTAPRVPARELLDEADLSRQHEIERLDFFPVSHGPPHPSDAASAPKFMISLNVAGWSVTCATPTTQSTA